jgi:hypothetical protein
MVVLNIPNVDIVYSSELITTEQNNDSSYTIVLPSEGILNINSNIDDYNTNPFTISLDALSYEIYTDDGYPISIDQLNHFLRIVNNVDTTLPMFPTLTTTFVDVRSVSMYTDKNINRPITNNLYVYENTGNSFDHTIDGELFDNTNIINDIKLYGPGIIILKIAPINRIGGSVGDPYIYKYNIDNVQSLRYKLPGKPSIYRLFGTFDTVVNVSISGLTRIEQNNIKNEYVQYTDIDVMNDGFYFDMFYIKYKDSFIHYDRYFNVINTHIVNREHLFIREDKTIRKRNLPLMGIQPYTTIIIQINHFATIELYRYISPQIINGIDVILHIPVDSSMHGILMADNDLHPSTYSIKSIQNINRLKQKERSYYKKQIVDVYQKIKSNY